MTRIRQLLPIVFALLLFAVSIWAISQELHHYSFQYIWQNLQAIPKSRKSAAITLTALGYLTMTGYDLLGFHYINQVLAAKKIAFTSFISYAVGNTIGFTAFSGTAIRYRFYGAWGVSKIKIAKLIVFTHLTFWLGLLAVSGTVFLVDPLTLPKILKLPFDSVHPIGLIFLLLVGLYFVLSLKWKKAIKIGSELFAFPSSIISLSLIALSAIDWGIAAATLYLLLPSDPSLTYAGFFGIYILALTAGLISTVPGGLGVFETVVLWLRPPSLSAPEVLGALLAYRVIYFYLPLLVALGLFVGQELFKRRVS
ncbi:lysylphosphatidylglycerol synthase domain-containing protein [Gloeothece verrucosa]|uniref:Integral membrane protein-like protein n=1 Tax=Gloeothece verrucosa (strain PCC 7822) TaxID=497965 RepID=E0UJ38_GLOV7|nr:lysylphosphatidylglycerol synthase domain-containing protein [Gloeothece verrucosa]ADN15741.1 conserved hypothetical protein [Gloeothece verrucosa PCC 7822]